MARGTQLSVLLNMLNAELGYSTASNPNRDAELTMLLSNMQQWLTTEYNWPFLERRWDVVVAPGQQYVGFPTSNDLPEVVDMNLERYPKVEVYWNTIYQPVAYGIGEDQYNFMNFALGQQSDPIQRWRAATNPNEPTDPNQFEVWPVPVTQQTIRFTGQRAVLPLSAPTDTADLDDMLLVYSVAAKKLTRAKDASAPMIAKEAARRLQWCKQNYPTEEKRRCLGNQFADQFSSDRKLIGMLIAVAGPGTPSQGGFIQWQEGGQ